MSRDAPDVLIVGGGVIGCAVAYALAARGRSVVVAERGTPGCGASTAAAGVLSVAGGGDEGARLALRRASLARWPALAAALGVVTGVDLDLRLDGTLELALSDLEAEAVQTRLAVRCAEGFRVEWIDAATLRAEMPCVAAEARGAGVFLDDGQVSPERVVEALVGAARVRGAQVLAGGAVREVERRGGRIVRVAVGERWLAPAAVVLAAGAWSAGVADLAPDLPVRPVRGQMFALRAPSGALARPVLHGEGAMVPRGFDTVLVGSTMEDAGFDSSVTPDGLMRLSTHLRRMAPAAVGWPLLRTWAGLRPSLAGGPVIARHPALENLVVASGHHRNGILLAPVTADAVAALVEGEAPPPETVVFGWPAGVGAGA